MARRIADLHPDDLATRVALRDALRDLRVQRGISTDELGRLLGSNGSNVRRDEKTGVDQSRAATIMRRARTLGRPLVLELVGFPTPYRVHRAGRDAHLENLLQAVLPGARDADETAVAALTEQIIGVRLACGVSQAQLAELFGTTEQSVSQFEVVTASAALVVLQRHARGIAVASRRPGAHLAAYLLPTHHHLSEDKHAAMA